MEKQIVTVSYWLGLLSSLIALVLKALTIFVMKGPVFWYMHFYKGALLFFLIAIATVSYASVRGEKTS